MHLHVHFLRGKIKRKGRAVGIPVKPMTTSKLVCGICSTVALSSRCVYGSHHLAQFSSYHSVQQQMKAWTFLKAVVTSIYGLLIEEWRETDCCSQLGLSSEREVGWMLAVPCGAAQHPGATGSHKNPVSAKGISSSVKCELGRWTREWNCQTYFCFSLIFFSIVELLSRSPFLFLLLPLLWFSFGYSC